MTAIALDGSDHRHTQRRRAFIAAKIRYGGGAVGVDCTVRNLSETGAKLDVSESVVLPAQFELVIPQKNVVHRAELRWRRGSETGVAFLDAAGGSADASEGRAEGAHGPAALSEDALRARIRHLEQEIVRLRARITELGG